VKAGRLDRTIIIETPTESRNDYGQVTVTWATHITTWADVMQDMGKEKVEDNNRTTERTVKFRIRYRTGLNNQMRILYESNYYRIDDIQEIKRKDGLLILTQRLAQT
jgi:SPP1 family predicted phage head-tail adaptor